MLFCPSCGKELSEEQSNAKFCAYCGKPLAEETVAEQTVAQESTQNTEAEKQSEIDTEAIKEKLNEAKDKTLEAADKAKDKTLEMADKAVEKAKTIPALAGIFEKVDKKFHPLLIAAPIAIVLLILVFIVGGAMSDSCMDPINDYIKLVNHKETDSMKYFYSLSPDHRNSLAKDLLKKCSKSEEFKDRIEKSQDNLDELFDDLDDEFKSWKLGFNVKEKAKVAKDDLDDYSDIIKSAYKDSYDKLIDQYEDVLDDDDKLEDFADELDVSEKEAKEILKAYVKYYKSFKDAKVTEAYEIKGQFTIKADKDSWKSDTVKITVVKVNGDWVYAGVNDSIHFEDDDEEIDLFSRFIRPLNRTYLKDSISYFY